MRPWKSRHDSSTAEKHAKEHGAGHPFGYGKGGRLFAHGEIRYVLLSLLAAKPSYGYELIKAIEERLNGAYAPSPGLVYPTLTQLEELEYIVAETNNDGKKLYSVTPQGKAFLSISKPIVDKISSHMSHAAALHKRTEDPQLLRAIENLRFTLKLKSRDAELTDTQIRTIADALDEAARKIESC